MCNVAAMLRCAIDEDYDRTGVSKKKHWVQGRLIEWEFTTHTIKSRNFNVIQEIIRYLCVAVFYKAKTTF